MGQYQPRVQQLVASISATGFTAVILLLGVLLISSVAQIQDILVQVELSSTIRHRVGFVLASVWFSIICWWTARFIFDQMALSNPENQRYFSGEQTEFVDVSVGVSWKTTKWLPRAYSLVLPLTLIYHGIDKQFWLLLTLTVVFVLIPVSLLVVFRRLLIKKLNNYFKRKNKQGFAAFCFHSWTWGTAVTLLYLIITVWALADPYSLGRFWGAYFVVYWGLGSVLFSLTAAVYFILPKIISRLCKSLGKIIPAASPRLEAMARTPWFSPPHPLLLIVVGYTVIVANVLNTDNHLVRTITPQQSQFAYSSFDSAWQHYKSNVLSKGYYYQQSGKKIVPVFFVASQGGGLRAAYWSAVGLSHLEQAIPGISNNIFSLAGVSGGSVGNSFYAAGLKERKNIVAKSCLTLQEDQKLACAMAAAVGEDYLSPVVTSFLYNDLLYRFLPISNWHFLYRDRAAVLETSWQRGFASVFADNLLDQGLQSMYSTQEGWLPLVLSMGSHQETGTRLIAAPFPIDSNIFVNQYSTYELMGCEQGQEQEPSIRLNCDMRISTSALTSARFPYVTPAGTLAEKKDWSKKDHIIDGGYVENYGLLASQSMMNYLAQKNEFELQGTDYQLLPVVIVFANDPEMQPDAFNPQRDRPYLNTGSLPLNELTNPIQGLLSTRSGRSVQSITETIANQQSAEQEAYFDIFQYPGEGSDLLGLKDTVIFHLPESEDGIIVPLGWWLSEESQIYMNSQYTISENKAYRLIQQIKTKLIKND